MKFFRHFKTVVLHKTLVFFLSIRVGIPWRGFIHDFSKFSPTEFFKSVKYFQGNQSPINAERLEWDNFSFIATHHSKRNKHHFEYWLDFHRGRLVIFRMPYKFVLEYVIDMLAASRVYKKKEFTIDYVISFFQEKMDYYPMHPDSKRFVLESLLILKNIGWTGYKKIDRKKLYDSVNTSSRVISFDYDNKELLIPKVDI